MLEQVVKQTNIIKRKHDTYCHTHDQKQDTAYIVFVTLIQNNLKNTT